MSTPLSIPPRPPLERLTVADGSATEDQILLVRNTGKNAIGSCFRGVSIPAGGLGYQVRALIEHEPWSSLLVPYGAPPEPARPVTPSPVEPDEPATADTLPPPAPPTQLDPRAMTARDAVAFVRAAGQGEYEMFRSDIRRSVQDAVSDRDLDFKQGLG